MSSSFLVYQAYGHPDILREAMLSVASALKFRSSERDFTIVIYTDAPDYFQRFLPSAIQYILIPKEKWEEWKGSLHFVHRAKIMMLLDALDKLDGNFLYCDTDTYFLDSPNLLFSSIREGNVVMHVEEGSLSNSRNIVFGKLNRFLKTYKNSAIAPDIHMWNAGVLGFSSLDKPLIKKVLELSDELYQAYPKHVMEQLAFSFYFGQKTRVACDKHIFHYWDFKEYRTVLKRFFEKQNAESFETWTQSIDSILPMTLIKKKQAYLKRPYILRKIDKWLGKEVRY